MAHISEMMEPNVIRNNPILFSYSISDDLDMIPEEGGLQSSLAEVSKEGADAVESKDDRINFTVWTTTKTTTTVTVMYTNTASTIRISYYCVAGGINLPNACAGNG